MTSPETRFLKETGFLLMRYYNTIPKFNDYKTLETLTEYVLISQDQMRVESFRRDASGNWIARTYEPGEEISFHSIDFSCPIASLYHKVSLLT